jgi:catechol 2,3-dioxygenase
MNLVLCPSGTVVEFSPGGDGAGRRRLPDQFFREDPTMSATALQPTKTDVSEPYFRVRRFGHANLFVSDYAKAYEFYNAVVGMEEAYRQPDNRASFVSNGNTYHDFGLTDITSKYAKPGQKPGLNHFAFEMLNEKELVDSYDKAVADGVKFAFVADHDCARATYQIDPEGNELEIYADVLKDWRSVKTGIIIKTKPKWIPGVTEVPLTESMIPVDFEHRVVPNAIFQPLRVASFGLAVNDFPKMFDFYRKMTGMTVQVGGREGPVAVLGGWLGEPDLAMYQAGPGVAAGMHHVGLEMPSEEALRGSIAKLDGAGIKPVRIVDHPARLAVTIADPDGILLQFFVDRDWRPEAIADVPYEDALYLF